MTKTVSARINNKDHQELLQRCNKVGCTINEWINEEIQYLLTNYSEFNFGDEEESVGMESVQTKKDSTEDAKIQEPSVKAMMQPTVNLIEWQI